MADAVVLFVFDRQGASKLGSDADTARTVVLGALKDAGYRVVETTTESHEATVTLVLLLEEHRGFIQVKQSGKVLGGYKANATLRVEAGGRVVYTAQSEFRFTEGEITADGELVDLVRTMNGSPKMLQLGTYLAGVRRDNAERAAVQQEADERTRYEEWHAQYVEPCADPDSSDACDGLESWLKENKGDVELAALWVEGSKVVSGSRPRIETMRDDHLWLQARCSECLEHSTEDACAGVKRYIALRPSGKHATEAREALNLLATRAEERARERELEIQRATAAERAQAANAASQFKAAADERERAAAKAQCFQQCRNGCGAFLDETKFKSCFAQCPTKCGP